MKKSDVWTVERFYNENLGVGVYCNDNTIIRVEADGTRYVELFGNMIFYKNLIGDYFFTLAGWNSNTTRARVNALLERFNCFLSSRNGTRAQRGRDGTCYFHGLESRPIGNHVKYRITDDRKIIAQSVID